MEQARTQHFRYASFSLFYLRREREDEIYPYGRCASWSAACDAGPLYSGQRGSELWDTFEHVLHVCEKEENRSAADSGDLFHRQPLIRELKELDYLFAGTVSYKGGDDSRESRLYQEGFQLSRIQMERQCVSSFRERAGVY